MPAGRAADSGEVVEEEESQDETESQSEGAQDVEGNAELNRSETATASERDETPHDEGGESQADERESLQSQADEQGEGIEVRRSSRRVKPPDRLNLWHICCSATGY